MENRGEGEGKRGHSGLLARQGMLLLFGDTGGGNELYIYTYTCWISFRFYCPDCCFASAFAVSSSKRSLFETRRITRLTDGYFLDHKFKNKTFPSLGAGGNFNTGSTFVLDLEIFIRTGDI